MPACALPRCASSASIAWIPRACWWRATAAANSAAAAVRRRISRCSKRRCFPAGRRRSTGAPCWKQIGGFDGSFFLYCEDTDLGLRARWAGWKCLYVPEAVVEHHYSHSAGARFAAEGVLRGAQPAVRAGEEFSGAACCWRRRSPPLARYLWHAWYLLEGRGSAARFRAEGQRRAENGLVRAARPRRPARRICRRLWRQRREIRAPRAHHPGHLPPPAAQPLHQRPEGGRAMIRADGPDSLLVIVPAFNEEGAIGEVVRVDPPLACPESPVLVIDDCSLDDTIARGARRPAPTCCRCRTTWAWAAACRPATNWPIELGFEYVIRVDGDGQHDARDIPRILERLKTSGCEMVIGSRFVERQRIAAPAPCASLGIRFFRTGAAAHSGQAGVRPHFRLRGREPPRAGRLQPQLSAGISGNRSAGGAAAPPLPLRGSARARCGRASPAALPSPPAKSLYYIVHVLLGVFVNMLKYDRRLAPGAAGRLRPDGTGRR